MQIEFILPISNLEQFSKAYSMLVSALSFGKEILKCHGAPNIIKGGLSLNQYS